jgi:hydroxymethylglutaryl-CoA lyase
VSERVRITDVSPRDGLQNEAGVISTADKARLVELLCRTGVDEVELTSFVSPKWVPQLADAAEMVSLTCDMVVREFAGAEPCVFSALIPNLKGLEALHDAESRAAKHEIEVFQPPVVTKISLFTAASETFSQKNTNASIDETIERFRTLLKVPRSAQATRAYVSCAIACPFEGPIHPVKVADVCARLVDLGVREIDLGDTIGAGTPETTAALIEAVVSRLGDTWLTGPKFITLHLHDTFGRAAECVRTGLEMGIRSFDGSVAGLGGCPYASTPGKRAPGNISTETLVRTVHDAGFTTGVDLAALQKAAVFAREMVARSRSAASGSSGAAG